MSKITAGAPLHTIQMLLRDLHRGVSSIAESTEDIVDPVLPEPIRRPLHSAIRALEDEGARLLNPRIDLGDIRSAAAFLRGKTSSSSDASKCASVLAFAWNSTQPPEEGHRQFLSETIAALRMAAIGNNDSLHQFERAAEIFHVLRRSNAAGSFPGFPLSPSEPEIRATELRLFAYFVWLLAERADTVNDELRNLGIALALARAFSNEIAEGIGEGNDLAAQFENLSSHLSKPESPADLENANAEPPLRKSAQRLSWLVAEFEEQVRRISEETGNRYSIDHSVLATVMADWLKSFLAQNRPRSEERVAFVGFAAGLMLRALIARNPIRLVGAPDGADASNPAYFWPEGYLYVAFCLNIRRAIFERDFHIEKHPSQAFGDVRTWWSFKENVEEDPALAIAFLDYFAGEKPQWTMPDIFCNQGAVNESAS